MATGSLPFTAGEAIFPDGTASNLFPALQRVKSSGAAPGAYFFHLSFDATNEEWVTFHTAWPTNYASAPVAKVLYKMASATANGVAWDVRLAAITSGDSTDADAKVFAAANVATDTVPATAGFVKSVSVTLTNADSVAAGDDVTIRLARATANAGDTATGDAEVVGLMIDYTTT